MSSKSCRWWVALALLPAIICAAVPSRPKADLVKWSPHR